MYGYCINCHCITAHKLPGEDGEFYQFCYVTSAGQIRGASTPFQFKNPSADDFVELDDEETNMLVIRSKTIVLEENIEKLKSEQEALVLGKQELECERDGLLTRLSETEKELQVGRSHATSRTNIQVQQSNRYNSHIGTTDIQVQEIYRDNRHTGTTHIQIPQTYRYN